MRWAAAAGIAVVAAGVVVAGVVLTADPSLDDQLGRRAVAALERAQPGVTPAHGHAKPANPTKRTDIDGNELVCVARVFGHDPAGATAVDEVTVVYAHRTCAAVGPGLAWPASLRETGPVAVRLGIPDTLVLPEKAMPEDPDATYADRIKVVIPTRYQPQALAYPDFVDPDVSDELRDRVDG
ncbi:hypothetical protein CLV71_101139 [Actinophytocola oryzae]|uniref:Uncharacterized protein n=2 Tax=Actinophytocola oryzae TaxID=502181 RepID=A0A4R7W5A5_9PSEU|nr:hypothetical protein CLV71_101139 [Actinophytocola oryzae]